WHGVHRSSSVSTSMNRAARHWGHTRISSSAGSTFMGVILTATDDGKHLVAHTRHGVLVVALDVESEQRFGVRGSDVEPPGGGRDGQAVEPVLVVLGVGLGEGFEHRGLVVDRAVDLS